MSKSAIALIGMRGSGKSAVGRALSQRLGLPLIDTDRRVVDRAGRSISEVFAAEGEAGFRAYERDAIEEAVATGPAVISVGGGAILDPRNVERLKRTATVVWLTAPVESLVERISSDPETAETRPPLTGQDARAELGQLLTERAPMYEAAADLVVETAGRSVEAVAAEVADRLERSS